MSQNPQNLKDNFFDKTKLSNLIKINFDKFNRTKIKLYINQLSEGLEPDIVYKDVLMYGIGNIVQNAIQHANKNINVVGAINSSFSL